MDRETNYLMDPEYLFEFAEISNDFPSEAYDELWNYFLKNCYAPLLDKEKQSKIEKEAKEARELIKSKQNGWCSIADLKRAGFCTDGIGILGKLIPREIIDKIADKYKKFPMASMKKLQGLSKDENEKIAFLADCIYKIINNK